MLTKVYIPLLSLYRHRRQKVVSQSFAFRQVREYCCKDVCPLQIAARKPHLGICGDLCSIYKPFVPMA